LGQPRREDRKQNRDSINDLNPDEAVWQIDEMDEHMELELDEKMTL
jgi:hypothetical protein